MFSSPMDALSILSHYKYLVIFPIAIFEGPIIIVISGFLVYLGHLNGIVAYIVLVIADMIGDSIYYFIGRRGGRSAWMKKYGKFVGYNENSEIFLEDHFKRHKVKTFFLAKISHGVGGAIQAASGIAKVNFIEFLFFSFIGTTIKTFVLIMIGFYAGSSYVKIDKYFDSFAYITVAISLGAIIGYILVSKYATKFLRKKEELVEK